MISAYASCRIECANCKVDCWKGRFSKNQMKKYQASILRERRGQGQRELPLCRECNPGNVVELTCSECRVTKSLDFFSNQQRHKPDDAVSSSRDLMSMTILMRSRNAAGASKKSKTVSHSLTMLWRRRGFGRSLVDKPGRDPLCRVSVVVLPVHTLSHKPNPQQVMESTWMPPTEDPHGEPVRHLSARRPQPLPLPRTTHRPRTPPDLRETASTSKAHTKPRCTLG